MPDDHRLLERLRARDSQAFGLLLEMYSDKLFRLAVSIVRDDEEAENIVQDAFLRFIETLDDFRGDSTVGTWLYRVTYNRALNVKRRYRTEADEAFDDDINPPTVFVDWTTLPEKTLLADETAEAIQAAIASLPESLQTVFVLREQEGLSTAQAADVLDLSESAVKVRLHRARLALREQLSLYFVTEEGL